MSDIARRIEGPDGAKFAWARLWARYVDLMVYLFVLSIIAVMIAPVVTTWNSALLSALLFPFTIPIGALVISTFGSSVGLWITGLRLETRSGEKIPFMTNLKREFQVYLAMGLGLPLVSFVTIVMSYNKLKETGTTAWDRNCKTQVVSRGSNAVRTWIAAGIYISVSFVGVAVELVDKFGHDAAPAASPAAATPAPAPSLADQLKAEATKMNATLPKAVDTATTLVHVDTEGTKITYTYDLKFERAQFDQAQDALRATIQKGYCAKGANGRNGVSAGYVYKSAGPSGSILGSFNFDPSDCPQEKPAG